MKLTAPGYSGVRPLPADGLVCVTLAALLWDTGRARFRELGIGPEAFGSSEAAAIAAVLLSESEFGPEHLRLLWRDDGVRLPWWRAMDWTLDPEWAVRIVERFAADRARWWYSRWLCWISEGLHEGWTLQQAVREQEDLLAMVRPLVADRRTA